jgi:hypothetical protein
VWGTFKLVTGVGRTHARRCILPRIPTCEAIAGARVRCFVSGFTAAAGIGLLVVIDGHASSDARSEGLFSSRRRSVKSGCLFVLCEWETSDDQGV